ncbi:MAG TPA: dual specificity protein phosphatase family protein, partial [Candidatus Thermoplasmatota archaeon]|nr:dual specificity protein phosphatase family protein [Candidatus Thermoplasmatota archaeon]
MRWRPTLLALASWLAVLPQGASAGAPDYAPSDPRNFTWTEEGVLAVGGGRIGGENVAFLKSQGFGAVANFRAERNDDEAAIRAAGLEYLYLPVEHAVDLNATQLRTFVAWAKEMERQGRPIYVHCTNGWHRAAAFSVAWEMGRHGLSFEEAAKRQVERRPGTVMRAPSALLQYEADLRGRDALVVLLQSPVARPEPGGEMPVIVEVLAGGRPVEGAKVRVWSEESRLDVRGTTGPDGRFVFTYRAPASHPMDHLYARASAEGHADGADDVELFYMEPVPATRQLDIRTRATPDGIAVQVLRNGHPHPARVVAWTPEGWSTSDATGTGATTLPLPEEGSVILVRAESWGSLGDHATVRAPRVRGVDRRV